ncbi:MAG: methionine--tRNA ligase, partial [Deltaproteobacteria bacterium]|nr:methionine--tRNA ligase [Deltaproteobacteria bacterium]
TPMYYVNDVPHGGHIYTTVVAATLARYHRLAEEEVYFLTGTDEHGQKIQRAAAEQSLEPLQLADRVVAVYHRLWKQLGMTHSDFVRTTEPRHRLAVEELIRRIDESGDFYLDKHEGWYCSSCETYYTEKELLPETLCPDHQQPTEWRSEENIFFRLSRYQERLLDWYGSDPAVVRPQSRLNEVRAFVESGLRDLSVSRSNLDWGIPFPGYEGQTTYVWLDALTNYITALGFASPQDQQLYETFWVDPSADKVHLVGKDILRFHAVYWPAFLMSAGVPLPSAIWAHGWWLRDERKMSKSVGNVARPNRLMEQYGTDCLRLFLLRDMVFGQDAQFSDEGCIDRFNSDLANDLGNTVSRLVTLSRKVFDGKTPPEPCFDNQVMDRAVKVVAEYHAAMEAYAFHRALAALWSLLAEASQYMVAREPWKLLKQEGESTRLSRVLWNSLEAVRIVAVGLLPFLPKSAPRVLAAIGVPEIPVSFEAMEWGGLPNSREIEAPTALFPRIDKEEYFSDEPAAADKENEEESGMIDIEQFSSVDLRVATVTAAEPIPKSRKLLQLSVDLGGEQRTLVAGIAEAYEAESLIGRQVVVVANLQPAKLMGVESQGMVLAASVDGRPVLLHPDDAVPDGVRVR